VRYLCNGLATLIAAMVSIPLLSASSVLAETRSVSPDGKLTYVCGNERQSHSGCYTHWVRSSNKKGQLSSWSPVWCPREKPLGGMCWSGGVSMWYWKGTGRIGDEVLKDFWVRDYANLDDPTRGLENPYGEALKIPGRENCYKARSFTVCMVPIKKKKEVTDS